MNRLSFSILVLNVIFLAACQAPSQPADRGVRVTSVDVALFTAENNLIRPTVDEWIFMGSSIGLAYARGEFSNDRPGTIQIVQMEPSAYKYFLENGEYAEGSMFSLAFYSIQEKPEPELNGFAQQDLVSFEIHLIDRTRFIDHRAFYLFNADATTAPMVPVPNDCIDCHNEHARYNGTFTQFYPTVRHLINN